MYMNNNLPLSLMITFPFFSFNLHKCSASAIVFI